MNGHKKETHLGQEEGMVRLWGMTEVGLVGPIEISQEEYRKHLAEAERRGRRVL